MKITTKKCKFQKMKEKETRVREILKMNMDS